MLNRCKCIHTFHISYSRTIQLSRYRFNQTSHILSQLDPFELALPTLSLINWPNFSCNRYRTRAKGLSEYMSATVGHSAVALYGHRGLSDSLEVGDIGGSGTRWQVIYNTQPMSYNHEQVHSLPTVTSTCPSLLSLPAQ